jgi:hypothetical protein
MSPTGNREAGDRNLRTADLAAAGRRPPQTAAREEEMDSPSAAGPMDDGPDAAERGGASMTDAAAKPAAERGAEQLEPLFSAEVASDYRARWAAVQSSFVDDPKRAVREGDELVAQMMKNLAQSFAAERGRYETQLGPAGDTTTETLRVSLRRYRSFFERLLSL